MTRTNSLAAVLVLSGVATLLLRCGETPTAGNGSQTPNGNVLGALYNQDGTPAGNAVVRFVPAT